MEHKELRHLLDAMTHVARVSFEKSGNLLPFAMALNDQGKIRQLAFPERRGRSAEDTARFIETGLKMLAQQLTCKAVGFCSEVRFPDDSHASHAEVVFILEHRDGSAYRVVIPDFLTQEPERATGSAEILYSHEFVFGHEYTMVKRGGCMRVLRLLLFCCSVLHSSLRPNDASGPGRPASNCGCAGCNSGSRGDYGNYSVSQLDVSGRHGGRRR